MRNYMSNKELLLGYVNTLSDIDCGHVYTLLTGEIGKDKFLTFDLVKITDRQYNKLIWMWGEAKTKKCIELLNEWLKEKGDKIKKNLSHYRCIIGWVERKYYQVTNTVKDKSVQNFIAIDAKWKALRYMKNTPKELWADDAEIQELIIKYRITPEEVARFGRRQV